MWSARQAERLEGSPRSASRRDRVDVRGRSRHGTEGEHLVEAGHFSEQLASAVGEVRVDDQRRDAGVVDHVGVVVGRAERVQRRAAVARGLAGAEDEQYLGPVQGQQPHRGAGAETELLQGGDVRADLLGELGPGQRLVPDVEDRLVGVLLEGGDHQVSVVRTGEHVDHGGRLERVPVLDNCPAPPGCDCRGSAQHDLGHLADLLGRAAGQQQRGDPGVLPLRDPLLDLAVVADDVHVVDQLVGDQRGGLVPRPARNSSWTSSAISAYPIRSKTCLWKFCSLAPIPPM